MVCLVPSLIVIACTTDSASQFEDNSITQENAAPSFSLKLTNGDTFNSLDSFAFIDTLVTVNSFNCRGTVCRPDSFLCVVTIAGHDSF